MQQFRFRLARGVVVMVAILSAHFTIAWLFDTMRMPVPDFGPVFPMFFDAPPESVQTRDASEPTTQPVPTPAQVPGGSPQTQPPVENGATPPPASAPETVGVAIMPPDQTSQADARRDP